MFILCYYTLNILNIWNNLRYKFTSHSIVKAKYYKVIFFNKTQYVVIN